mmetsp:Transcript_4489/g.8259  ORF Transcript_4489/g.8259 Transcript_4489/m.8259 type:complete len:98 (+) Transcript_4489:3367-3660(+)
MIYLGNWQRTMNPDGRQPHQDVALTTLLQNLAKASVLSLKVREAPSRQDGSYRKILVESSRWSNSNQRLFAIPSPPLSRKYLIFARHYVLYAVCFHS